jgi:NADPH-dependent 2,4-dienoyl-CoA reductase/sulfur reductase-like enzyme/rhodanese-related sulfurtransferase
VSDPRTDHASTQLSPAIRASHARRRVLVVGGVAGGASAAARLRRLDEECEIVLFDRGHHVSFANCGLPYHVGNVIPEEGSLLVASRELFRARFNIDVRTEHDVLAIDRERRAIRVRDLRSGAESEERYDVLVLAPGAAAVVPEVPGVSLPGVFVVRTIPDTRRIRGWLEDKQRAEAVVVGGGFIGLEMAENLARRGLRVTIVEKVAQVMSPVDPEVAAVISAHLREQGVALRLGEGLESIEGEGDRLAVQTDAGGRIAADLVILAIGVRPESTLARAAGLLIGARGGIAVDERMRTSDPDIYAVGDAIEVRDVVIGQEVILPLAGPANRQGRIAAEAIAGRATRFRGVQGTAIVSVFGLTVACTGASEKGLRRAGVSDYGAVYLHPGHHAGYFPGARPIHVKLLYARGDGRVLGAQAVGTDGVDKRIDVIAAMIQMRGTVHDLAEAELCYAPQFGAAKDPVNVAGMMAANALQGDMLLADWMALPSTSALLLDVREPPEYEAGALPRAVNIPLSELRQRIDEVPRGRELWLYCAAGQRAYFAQRLLLQRGHDAHNLCGGYTTYISLCDAGLLPARARPATDDEGEEPRADGGAPHGPAR